MNEYQEDSIKAIQSLIDLYERLDVWIGKEKRRAYENRDNLYARELCGREFMSWAFQEDLKKLKCYFSKVINLEDLQFTIKEFVSMD